MFFDKAVFNESSFSPELAKRAFLKAKGHDIDAVVSTSAIERRLGYMEGLELRDDVYVPYPVRHEFKSSETSGVLYYGGEDVMEIEPVEYMRNRVRYSQFYVERISTFMMHQLDRQYLGVTYADFYRKNMALVGSELIMIAEGRISLITLKHLWEKGDGRVPNTVNEGYYYLYIPTFTDIESPWVLLVDFRIFPGPPPNDYEAVSEMLQASTKTREPIAPGRNAIAWFEAFEEFCYGNKIDRLSSLSALATLELYGLHGFDDLGIPPVTILRVSKTPLRQDIRNLQNEWYMKESVNHSSPSSNESVPVILIPMSSTEVDRTPYVSAKIPFGHEFITFDRIRIPSILQPYPSLIAREEEDIITQALVPRPSVVMMSNPTSGFTVLVQGADLLKLRDREGSSFSRETRKISFVSFGLTGKYAESIFEKNQVIVLIDMQLLRDKRKAVSVRIIRDLVAVADMNDGLDKLLNEYIDSTQILSDLDWFSESVIYGSNTTEPNPRWDLHSGERMASALGAPPLPIYHYFL